MEVTIHCETINLSSNKLTDEAVGSDFTKVLQRMRVKIIGNLDLSQNNLGRKTLVKLR